MEYNIAELMTMIAAENPQPNIGKGWNMELICIFCQKIQINHVSFKIYGRL